MKIMKIKLINWHIFSNETISFKNNLLITGENGCGKSTLMDAIYYLISGGDDKHFNQAAGQGGNRTLETYMRCKVGNEGQEYIRQGSNVISYIAIEMVNEEENRHNVLGVCLEIIDNSSKAKPSFFFIPDYSLRDSDFIDGKAVYSYQEFKGKLQAIPGYYDLSNARKREIRQAIGANIFRIKNYSRFYELLQKAISFNPITEVSSFVNEFLLEESNVDLNSLIAQIRNYQEFKEMIAREESKIKFLDMFIKQAENYNSNAELINNSKIILKEKQIVNNKYLIKKANDKILYESDKKDKLDSDSKEISNRIEELIKNISDLERNDQLKLYNDSNKKLELNKFQLKELERKLNNLLEDIQSLNELGQRFEFKNDLRKYIQNKDYSNLKINLSDLNEFLNDNYEKLISERVDFEREKTILKDKKSKSEIELNNLKNGKNSYKREILLLVDILTSKIKEIYPYDEVYIRPFCEYLEVIDDEWIDALEGFLDKQRFNLIIDPKYFTIASKEYERVKEENHIYGVGLVNIGAIKNIDVVEGSLYNKVSIDNKFADIYARKLLGRVMCCDNIEEIKQHQSAITREVMIYKNHVLKACPPTVYEKPFLGLKSRLKRIEILENEIKEYDEEYSKISNELDFINNSIISIKVKPSVRLDENLWQKISIIEKENEALEKQIEELKNNSSLIENAELIDKYKKDKMNLEYRRDSIQKEKENIISILANKDRDIKNYNFEILNLEKDLACLLNQNKDIPLLDEYREKYATERIDDLKKIIDSAKDYNDKETSFLSEKIAYYSNHFNPSLPISLENLKDYINEYYRLKNEDIANYKEKANVAYKTAEESFKKDFIAKLKEKIDNAKVTLKKLNKKLSLHTFGTDKEIFSFDFGPSKDKEYAEYYRIIESGDSLDIYSLLDSVASSKDQEIMKQLFDKISINAKDENTEKMLHEYLDYRKYMSYDIKIVDKNDEVSYFSKINKEKSGGETQTPFYIIMAACFEELLGKDDSVCCIILDEAFNNMDEDRIKSMMEFYKELKIQVIIIVPTIRFSAIFPYCDTIVGIVKNKNRAKIAPIHKNEKD